VHDTAALTGNAFFRCYGDPLKPLASATRNVMILDVGSLDVNGSLRPYAQEEFGYIGVDQVDGPGVNQVLEDPHKLPFPDGFFDLVVSTSCLEHDPMFWLTFAEMARVVKPGGFVYISAPSNGPYHGHPGDCWRFYADAPKALADWAKHCGHTIELVETFMMPPIYDVWIDCVAVFGKPPIPKREKLFDRFPNALMKYGRLGATP
jgi:SAM-dependent methyltransferase